VGGFDILERLGRGIPRLEELIAPENVWGRLNREGSFLDTAGDIARELVPIHRRGFGGSNASPIYPPSEGQAFLDANPSRIQSGSLVDMVDAGAAGQSWQNVQTNIAQARFDELKAGLDQLRRQGGGGGGGGNSGIIDARIARAKKELAEGNVQFDNFFEAISPGFDEALDQAKRVAEAEAAIEGHFTNTQEAIDERYASAEGGVMAIADSLGNTSPSLAEAIHTSIFEFKEFIDQDLHLEREAAVALNAAASSLAVAAAKAAHQGARGAGARDQFVFQKKYEKIIQNLLDQRSSASGARGNALRGAAEQLLANYRSSQPYTRQQMGDFVMFDMVNQVVPPAQQQLAYTAIQTMQATGVRNWMQFKQILQAPDQNGVMQWKDPLAQQTYNVLAPFANVIESAVSRATQTRIDEMYNQMFQDPQTSFDRFNVEREQAFNAGFDFSGATDYANTQLIQSGAALNDLGSILDQLERDGYGDLFGLGG
jgi:hypothetical protein